MTQMTRPLALAFLLALPGLAVPGAAVAQDIALPEGGALSFDQAKTGTGAIKGAPPASTAREPHPQADSDFVFSNVIETLYHELGHALIDTMDLPVFGPEEFAVDYFSVVLINRMFPDDEALAMTYDIAAAYEQGAVYEEFMDGDEVVLWDVHGPSMQRYYNLVCNMYGASPATRHRVVDDLGLPKERAATCEAEYALTEFAWAGVLEELGDEAPGNSLWIDPASDLDSPIGQMVAGEIHRLNTMFVLPRQITVTIERCDEANAFYDPAAYEMIMCTELEDELARMAPQG